MCVYIYLITPFFCKFLWWDIPWCFMMYVDSRFDSTATSAWGVVDQGVTLRRPQRWAWLDSRCIFLHFSANSQRRKQFLFCHFCQRSEACFLYFLLYFCLEISAVTIQPKSWRGVCLWCWTISRSERQALLGLPLFFFPDIFVHWLHFFAFVCYLRTSFSLEDVGVLEGLRTFTVPSLQYVPPNLGRSMIQARCSS